jgi:hypothetical protein
MKITPTLEAIGFAIKISIKTAAIKIPGLQVEHCELATTKKSKILSDYGAQKMAALDTLIHFFYQFDFNYQDGVLKTHKIMLGNSA